MPSTLLGLPIHPLIVHATVVLVPTAALLVAGSALWPRLRVWAGPLPAVVAVIATGLVPLTTSSGEDLEGKLGHSALIRHHAELGDTLIWFVLPLAVVAVLSWFLRRRGDLDRRVVVALAVIGVALAGGTLVDVALIGHSGAKAAWSGVGNQ